MDAYNATSLFFILQTQEIVRLNGIYKRILANSGVTSIEGAGSIVDAHTVEVAQPDGTQQKYTAKHILIATGSRSHMVDIPGKVCEVPHAIFF